MSSYFINKYNIRHVSEVKSYCRDERYFNYSSLPPINARDYFYEDRIVELEIPMQRLNELVYNDRKAEEMEAHLTYERQMQIKHPQIREAYEKYQLLLKLYE